LVSALRPEHAQGRSDPPFITEVIMSNILSSAERAAERNAAELESRGAARRKRLAAGLEKLENFGLERVENEDELRRSYQTHNERELKGILAQAAAREAAAFGTQAAAELDPDDDG
jgi:hypothetical protein